MKISKELYEFFKAYKRWVEEGTKTSEIFSRRTGSCHNLIYYQERKGLSPIVHSELRKLLDNEFGKSMFPFGEDSYAVRSKERTQHLCPKRIAFVDKCIEAYESTGNEENVVESKSECSLKIGDKVKGVKFSDTDYPHPGWSDGMSKYIGKVGEVLREAPTYKCFHVRFEDGKIWSYPAHLLKKVDSSDNESPKHDVKKGVTPKSVWGVVNMETGDFITIELSREKARQMKARLNGEFKIAKMVFDKWVR